MGAHSTQCQSPQGFAIEYRITMTAKGYGTAVATSERREERRGRKKGKEGLKGEGRERDGVVSEVLEMKDANGQIPRLYTSCARSASLPPLSISLSPFPFSLPSLFCVTSFMYQL